MKPGRVNSMPVLLSIFSMVMLGACGSGGGSSSNESSINTGDGGVDAAVPDAPVLSLTFQSTKTFHFSWPDVAEETEYRLLEDPDSISGYTQIATISADVQSHDIVVSLPGRINARYILQACNTNGCTDSAAVDVSATLADAIGYVKASNTEANDQFGYSTALAADGNTLAVGAVLEDSNATGIDGTQGDNSAGNSGAVYVFTRSGTSWSQQAYIKASNAEAGDFFGVSIALAADGNTLAVGAYGEDSKATGINSNQDGNNSLGTSGAVYVFTRSGTTWSQQAYVKASNTGAGDDFGYSVALAADGDTLAVGAVLEDSNATGINGTQGDNSAGNSGAVYVFTRSGTTWSQQAYVKASNTGSGDQFGYSVALAGDGNTLAVGANLEDSNTTGVGGDQSNNSAFGSGAAYVFTRSGATWSQQAYIKASNTGTSDAFGYSISLAGDGDTLAVGATKEDSNASGIGGDQGNNTAGDSGAVYIFTRSGTTWSQQAYIKASNTGASDAFGYSISLAGDGDTLAVGARSEAGNTIGLGGDQSDDSASSSGAAYVFSRSGAGWGQQAYVKAPNTGSGDWFGYSLALAADNHTLAVGAIGEDSNARGVDSNQADNSAGDSGTVYLY